jgi:hypothetical protein
MKISPTGVHTRAFRLPADLAIVFGDLTASRKFPNKSNAICSILERGLDAPWAEPIPDPPIWHRLNVPAKLAKRLMDYQAEHGLSQDRALRELLRRGLAAINNNPKPTNPTRE